MAPASGSVSVTRSEMLSTLLAAVLVRFFNRAFYAGNWWDTDPAVNGYPV